MKVTIINSFTSEDTTGNPAGVCVVDTFPDEAVMQSVAKEMSLSETAFVCPQDNVKGSYNLRWFTPTSEVDLCGHATLATAHYMWREGVVPDNEEISFYTRSGVLKAVNREGYIWLDFPKETINSCDMPVDRDTLKDLLGIDGSILFSGVTSSDIFIEVESESVVRNLKPDMDKLKEIETRGFIVTARGSGEYSFVSRFFAPRYGIPEDPVTGSAHTSLCPYWAEKLGKFEMTGCQLSLDKDGSPIGGVVKVELDGDRVKLGGMAEMVKVVEVGF